jgi:TonB family protein
MMTHDDNDAGENLLAGIDLHTWRVPPPTEVHRPSLLVRALSPATPTKRPRVRWLVAGLVLFNAAIAALLVILLSRPAPSSQTVVYQAAGGGSVDAQVRDLLARLESEQRELERRLAEIKELRALVTELSEKVRLYEQQDRRERTVPRPRDNKTPAPSPMPAPTPSPDPIDPYESANPPNHFSPPSTTSTGGCDEVSCVLGNYSGACCAKFRKSQTPPPQINNGPPENLTRQMISTGIANVRGSVSACGDIYKIKGKVKVRVQVEASGRVTNVEVEVTPDAMLGACVANALQRAKFDKTRAGGSFSYPFIF